LSAIDRELSTTKSRSIEVTAPVDPPPVPPPVLVLPVLVLPVLVLPVVVLVPVVLALVVPVVLAAPPEPDALTEGSSTLEGPHPAESPSPAVATITATAPARTTPSDLHRLFMAAGDTPAPPTSMRPHETGKGAARASVP
jgi:hypothetical protein